MKEFAYEDRMKGIPVHDEQGTRDRPFFLRMTADAAKLGGALKNAGLEIWRGRPDIEVLLTVRDSRGTFLVAAEEPSTSAQAALLGYRLASAHYDGYEQREVLKSIATKHGLPIVLPRADTGLKPGNGPLFESHCPLLPGITDGNCIRYRADLIALPSGYWHLDARAWALSSDLTYADVPGCFHFDVSGVTFDTALRESLDAAAQWARRDKAAVDCGLSR
jgi:hypothetical protein